MAIVRSLGFLIQDFATSHLCPHYKAPLAKGVLSVNAGKISITCPWHGACFDVKSGDIEDAPSIDCLQSYKVVITDDNIEVSADSHGIFLFTLRLDVKSSKRIPKCLNIGSDKKKTVIIGGGAAGFSTAESLRSEGYTGKIEIISREDYLPIDRPKLSKSLKVDVSKITLRDAQHYKDFGIEMTLNTVYLMYLKYSKFLQLISQRKWFVHHQERI